MQTLKIDKINLPKLNSSNVSEISKKSFPDSPYRVPQQRRRLSIKANQEEPSSVQQYHNMFNRRQLELRQAGRQTLKPQRKLITDHRSYSQSKQQHQRQTYGRFEMLRGITRQIKQIRRQISYQKEIRAQSLQRNINRVAALRRDENSYSSQVSQMPMIIPVYLPMPFAGQTQPLKYHIQRPRDTRIFDSYKTKSRISLPSKRKNHNISRKWKKYVYTVVFVSRLKKFCKLVRIKRKNQFSKIFTSLGKKVNKIKDELIIIIKQCESGIFGKKGSLSITQADDEVQKNTKVALLRGVVNQILAKIKAFFQKNKSNRVISQSLYHLCSHGNYSCSQPLLTKQQLQMSCISVEFGYVSADPNLQSIALVNLIVIKLLLFNVLLAKNRYELSENDYKISQNTLTLSSVIYELALDIENEFFMKAPTSYEIGNYQNLPKIRGLSSMSINNSMIRRGELISGLRQNKSLANTVNLSIWTKQKKIMMKIIEIARSITKKYHSQLTKEFLG